MARHWLGIDIGGTFTDFTLFDTETGELLGLKVPSTPHEFAEAVRVGLARLADEHGVDLREIGTVRARRREARDDRRPRPALAGAARLARLQVIPRLGIGRTP
jgi:predicted NBD/HSP70 family sugar kinase